MIKNLFLGDDIIGNTLEKESNKKMINDDEQPECIYVCLRIITHGPKWKV